MGRISTRADPRDPLCGVIRIAALCVSRLRAGVASLLRRFFIQ